MRQEQKASTYRFLSARNASLGLFVWGMVFILLALSILIPVPYQWIYTLIAFLACTFLLAILYHTYYELRPNDILINYGLLRKHISYTQVLQASLCQNHHLSYALASQRVSITYQTKRGTTQTIYVSPIDCEGFFILLQAACPHL